MAASILQGASSQSNPGGTFTNPQGVVQGSGTTAGSLILAGCALSFDTLPETFTCTDTLLQAYTQVDYLSKSGDYNFALFKKENSLALPAPIAITFTGALSIGATTFTLTVAWAHATATYIVTFSTGEVRPVTLTNGSATATTWGDGLGKACTASATAGYGPYFQCTADGDFASATMLEIGGVPTSSVVVAHNAAIISGVTNAANNLNAGSLACGSGSGLLVMLCVSTSNGGGSPHFYPSVGTSPVAFTAYGSPFWDYGGGNAVSIWQYAHLSAPGTITPTASAAETTSDDYFMFALFLADAAASVPLIPIDTSARVIPRASAVDFAPPNLLAQQTLKLPPFIQSELPGWAIRARGVYTDFAPPNVLTPGTLKLPPFTQENDGARTFWRGVYTDFTPPNLALSTLIAIPAPVKPQDLSQRVIRWAATDFAPPNLLTQGTLKLPPFTQSEPGAMVSVRGVFSDFSPPSLVLNTLIAKAPFVPVESARITYRGVFADFTAPNLSLSTLAVVPVAPLLPQDISGIRLEARGLRSDFLPPNLTLILPVRPPVVSSGAGRHGTQAEARRRRELDVLRAKIEAFKEQRAEAEKALIATEDREVSARTRVLKRIRLKAPSELSKPVEHYAPVKKAIAQRNVALERHRAILTHLTRHQLEVERLEREVQQGDEEATLYLMQWLMMETEWRE